MWKITSCNDVAARLMQRDLVGSNFFEDVISPLTSLASALQMFPSIRVEGEIWTRDTLSLKDGMQCIALRKTEFSRNSSAISSFQVQWVIPSNMTAGTTAANNLVT